MSHEATLDTELHELHERAERTAIAYGHDPCCKGDVGMHVRERWFGSLVYWHEARQRRERIWTKGQGGYV